MLNGYIHQKDNAVKGAGQPGGHRTARRTPIWQESPEQREGCRIVRKAPSHPQRTPGRFYFTLWDPTGNLELSSSNSALCTNPLRYALDFHCSFRRQGIA